MELPLVSDLPGVGIDLVDVGRLADSLERGGTALRNRIFTTGEQEECGRRAKPIMHLAARLAAKEAGMKALGSGWTGGVGFCDFEVVSDGRTAPKLLLHGEAAALAEKAGIAEMRLSLSHTDHLAIAIVVCTT